MQSEAASLPAAATYVPAAQSMQSKLPAAAGSDAASDCIGCAAGRSSGVGSTSQSACTTPGWLLADAASQSCDTVCAAAGHACTSGDWGVGDQASLEAALAWAGQSSGDRASLCSGGYSGNRWDGSPRVAPSSDRCYWQSGGTTSCSASDPTYRRLCRCA